jgi:DNA adenine methylase
MDGQLSIFGIKTKKTSSTKVVNVASVPQRSPFRYPGGKTWLVPEVRKWLKQQSGGRILIEPFAGGGIVSLTAAFENLADEIVMVELDQEVAAVWQVIINGDHAWLANEIQFFDMTTENIDLIFQKNLKTVKEKAFCTIIKNRISHGGIITKGAGLIKKGEGGKGIRSRWYPKTLHDRILAIGHVKSKMKFVLGDGFEELDKLKDDPRVFAFIDPPYTIAGKRLYTHFDIDHDKLFALVENFKGKFMMTYDDTEEIRALAAKYMLDFRTIPMKTTHHVQKNEIIFSDNFDWWEQ